MLWRSRSYISMKTTLLSAILISAWLNINCQNLIGYNDNEIKRYMKENHRNMNLTNVTNDRFKYLKYSDNYDNQTLLFFLTSDSVCKSIRVICDRSIKSEKVKEFNTIYSKKDEGTWIDKREGKNYLIEIKDEEWSCIITIEPEK